MIVLTIRTDKPVAEIGLFDNDKKLTYEIWLAHRQLSKTIHKKIEILLKGQHKTWQDIQGIICYKGPGSFTGLRIGLTVGNALALSNNIPIVSSEGEEWLQVGIRRLQKGENEQVTLPNYGGEVNITKPHK